MEAWELSAMTSQKQPQLSKSRFMAGLQCLKRLYLECYHRELADPVDVGQQAIFDSRTAVGELARQLFPSGRLVNAETPGSLASHDNTETHAVDPITGFTSHLPTEHIQVDWSTLS